MKTPSTCKLTPNRMHKVNDICRIFDERACNNADWLWAIKVIRTREKSVQAEFSGPKNPRQIKTFRKMSLCWAHPKNFTYFQSENQTKLHLCIEIYNNFHWENPVNLSIVPFERNCWTLHIISQASCPFNLFMFCAAVRKTLAISNNFLDKKSVHQNCGDCASAQ